MKIKLLLTALFTLLTVLHAADAPKPNVVILFIDDMGYADIGPFGASPTKAWLVTHRNDPEGQKYYDLAFGKRPAKDPRVTEIPPRFEQPPFTDAGGGGKGIQPAPPK